MSILAVRRWESNKQVVDLYLTRLHACPDKHRSKIKSIAGHGCKDYFAKRRVGAVGCRLICADNRVIVAYHESELVFQLRKKKTLKYTTAYREQEKKERGQENDIGQ